jgi:hypothetical protein
VALSTSPGLLVELGLGSPEHRDLERLHDESRARQLEYRSVGGRCPVSGSRRLAPNHVLHLPSGRIERLPMRHRDTDVRSVTAELGLAMQGLQTSQGGDTWLPVTAGLDSRWLAWAAAELGVKVKMFTFSPAGRPSPEGAVAAMVAKRLGGDHSDIALPAAVSDAVREDITAVRGAWRDLPKMAEIEHFAGLPERVLVLNGNGGEAVRGGGYLGTGPRPVGRHLVRALCLGPGPSSFDRAGFDRWFDSLGPLARLTSGIELDGLFYWEQRLPHWGSDFFAEKENYVDELSPFCCRRFLLASPALGGRRAVAMPLTEVLDSDSPLEGMAVNPHVHHSVWRRYSLAKSTKNLALDAARAGLRQVRG